MRLIETDGELCVSNSSEYNERRSAKVHERTSAGGRAAGSKRLSRGDGGLIANRDYQRHR